MDIMRSVSAGMQAALSGPFFYPCLMVWLDWPGDEVRAHTGRGSIIWGGEPWHGVGEFGSVSVPEESASGVPVDFSLSLVCDLAELAEYADAVVRQREGRIYLGATTGPGGNVLVGDPVELIAGTMDTLVLTTEVQREDGSVQILYTLTVGMTTGPSMRSMASIVHSHEDQSRQFLGDTAGKRLILASARAAKTYWPEA